MRAWLHTASILLIGFGVALTVFVYGERLHFTESQFSATIPARLAAKGVDVEPDVLAREYPVKVASAFSSPELVREEDLVLLLVSAAPRWNPPTVPALIHELKLWGKGANFTESMLGYSRTGPYILETLLNDKACRENTTRNGGSFLLDSPFGIRVVRSGTPDGIGSRGEGHFGQLLKALGEAGVPSTTPVTTASGNKGTIANILDDTIMEFSAEEELEFVACAFAYWLPPRQTWTNKFGTDFTFDWLVLQLVNRPLGQGPCGGCHLPYALAILSRVDSEHRILSSKVRTSLTARLQYITHQLEIRTCPNGGWDKSWAGDTVAPSFLYGDDVLDRITVTGHHLEWIANSTTSLHMNHETIASAVKALVSDVQSLQRRSSQSFKTELPLTHAARALALLRREDPNAVFKDNWDRERIWHRKSEFESAGM